MGGEGGYVPAPVEFLQGLQKVCKKHGILLIIDEVQTGFGRTGKLLAHTGLVEPDILVMAKGLASGYPISAVAARASLADQQAPGSMGGPTRGTLFPAQRRSKPLRSWRRKSWWNNLKSRAPS